MEPNLTPQHPSPQPRNAYPKNLKIEAKGPLQRILVIFMPTVAKKLLKDGARKEISQLDKRHISTRREVVQ